jgi:PAS domain S-box-containing protein
MSSAPRELEPVNILLVDDRRSNLQSLEATLRRDDYRLVLASSGEEALAQVLRQEFALILLDVAMPIMDGFQTASMIKDREQSRHIPIIFVTASVYDLEHIFRGYNVGAVDYLRKPLDLHEVRSKVAVFVEMYRQRKQIERQAVKLREAELRQQRLARQHAEEALRKSETIYQLTFEEAPVGIGHASPDGLWTKVNARLCEILGRERHDIVGHSIVETVAGEDGTSLSNALVRLRSGEMNVYAGEFCRATEAGPPVWCHVTLSAMPDAPNGATWFIVIIDDITDQKKLELERFRLVRELRHAVRARDDFLALAAHELKTPITPLRLQAAGLLRELHKHHPAGRPPLRLERRLETINTGVERLEDLIDRLLSVSRLSIGRITLVLEDVELGALVREQVARRVEEARETGSTLLVSADQPVVGRWDRVRIEQVIANLLSNAIRYGEGRPIQASVVADGDLARVSVHDQGVGIPQEAQGLIFERFERLAPVRHHGGLGLGLWIVRQIVEAHSGRVTLVSYPGEGSVFTVELPLRLPTAQSVTSAEMDRTKPATPEARP